MKLNRAKCIFIIILLMSSVFGAAASELSDSIDALLAAPALKHGVQGVVIESLPSGEVLYKRNGDVAFVPASNMKLIVSTAALDKFGPDYTFPTRLYCTGTINDGTLNGDLIIVGGGDPVLSTSDLHEMVDQIKAKGITGITGKIIADDCLFDKQCLGNGWAWDDEPYYYSAQINALNLDRNVVEVTVHPGKSPGDKADVVLDTPSSYFVIENSAITAKSGSENTILIDRARGRNVIRITGSIPIGAKENEPITMEEPALYTATILRDLLAESGIQVAGKPEIGKKSDTAKLIAEHKSPPLSKILALLLKPSDNLIAEVLLKDLGAYIKGKGTSEAGEQVELEFLKNIGVDTNSLAIYDGSGLSRRNYITPADLITLLTYMSRHKHSQVFIDALPVAGVDGTLRNRMKGTPAERSVRAKTGYVSHVSALSGYVTTGSGQTLVFSIIMNAHMCSATEARKVQDDICAVLSSQF